MIKELNLVNRDLILNSTRVLILISKFESRKAYKLNSTKIMLFDFYMKFPVTMLPKEVELSTKEDFNESYSFFHARPDREEYQLYLRYLVSKRLVDRVILGNDFCYRVNNRGKEVVQNMESDYSFELHKIADYIKRNITKLSESAIEDAILNKSYKNREL